jgi:hypothetical protein
MQQTETMRWRRFTGADADSQVMVETFETPIGQTCTPAHSKLVATEIVTHERAIELLRTKP